MKRRAVWFWPDRSKARASPVQSLNSLNDQIASFMVTGPKPLEQEQPVSPPPEKEPLQKSMTLMRHLLVDAQTAEPQRSCDSPSEPVAEHSWSNDSLSFRSPGIRKDKCAFFKGNGKKTELTEAKILKMMDDNKQLAQRIDGAIQSASQEVTNLRSELSATSRRLAELGASDSAGVLETLQQNHNGRRVARTVSRYSELSDRIRSILALAALGFETTYLSDTSEIKLNKRVKDERRLPHTARPEEFGHPLKLGQLTPPNLAQPGPTCSLQMEMAFESFSGYGNQKPNDLILQRPPSEYEMRRTDESQRRAQNRSKPNLSPEYWWGPGGQLRPPVGARLSRKAQGQINGCDLDRSWVFSRNIISPTAGDPAFNDNRSAGKGKLTRNP
ncbi:Kazrin [Liparis tanakae]|uniref:Kazrin n=1 Tax=Liparis tanakae TaxID=230148 RepID=A0A4Z2IGZ0_9TELE|nr:Kazrin [Liparis tanakae]